jgi:hypothetical protein
MADTAIMGEEDLDYEGGSYVVNHLDGAIRAAYGLPPQRYVEARGRAFAGALRTPEANELGLADPVRPG